MQQLHAHRCVACLQKGTHTVWIHDESAQGVAASHTCPKCGKIEWKKFMVQVPQHKANPVTAINKLPLEMILGYMAIFLGACVILGLILAISKKDGGAK